MPIRPQTRDEFRAATPDRYLADGWLDRDGRPWPEVNGVWATAAAEQWLAAEVAVAETEITLEAFNQALPYYGATADRRVGQLAAESLSLARGVMGQPNHPALVSWLEACLGHVRSGADGGAFMAHFRSAVLQYKLIARAMARRA